MKTTLKMLAMVMLCVMSVAGFAVAADDIFIDIENENNINATGGNANAEQHQNQTQEQKQKQQLIFNERTQLPHLQYGTNFVNPGNGIQNKGWFLYQSPIYAYLSAESVESMRRHFQFSDIFFWNWKSRMNISMVNKRLPGNPSGIALMNYWPGGAINPGDMVIASITVRGDVNWPEESFLGMAAQACIEEAGSDRYAVQYTVSSKGITNGASVSIGGAVSQVASSGTKGAVITSGGQLGTIETSVEDYKMFEVKCMNRGEINLIGVRAPALPAPVQVIPPTVCDPTEIWIQINELKRRIALCTKFCFNNLQLRSELGEKYIELAVCTGDKKYLEDAKKSFEIAERNYKFGKDIKKHRKQADSIMRRVDYLHAGCLNQIYGLRVATDFANQKDLEKFPSSFEK